MRKGLEESFEDGILVLLADRIPSHLFVTIGLTTDRR